MTALPTLGTSLLGLGAVASLVAAFLLAYSYAARTDDLRAVIVGSAVTAAGALVAAQAYLTYQFVVGDYTNAYVWENSADYLSLVYRVTGVYASHEGSILLWASLTAVVAAWTVRSSGFDGRGGRLAQSLALAVVAVFASMLVVQSPFTPLEAAYPDVSAGFVPPDGDGLNPLLVDPWMAIHPPLTFSAYALSVVPFGLGVAHFVSRLRGEPSVFDDWLPDVIGWLRVSWLLLTAAIVCGGVWAYGVLGWGGFWSWDPVETAVLVPWLGLTATLHAINRHEKTGEYSLFAPAATALLFPLIVFATTVVRSGVFRSVHSFASGGVGSGSLFLLGTTGALAVVLPLAHWLQPSDGDDDDDDDEQRAASPGSWFTRRTMYHGAVLTFVVLAFVAAWGLAFPVVRNAATGVEVSVSQDHYNLWSYPVVVAALVAGGCYALLDVDFGLGADRRTVALGATGVVAALTVAAAFVAPSSNWLLSDPDAFDPLYYRVVGNVSVFSVVPPAAFFAGGWTARFVARVRGAPSRAFQLRETGVVLVHVGAAVLVVAVSFVYLFATSASVAVVGIDQVQDSPEPVVQEVPNSSYTVHVDGYETVERPPIERAAYAPETVRTLDAEAVLVRGAVTETDTVNGTAVARLDDTDVWLASGDETVAFEAGTEVVARATVLGSGPGTGGGGGGTDPLYLYTDAANFGPLSDPPTDAYTPRVRSHELSVTVYDGDERVASGTVAEQSYSRSEMNTNDALIERGPVADTYVVGRVSGQAATVTIDRYPLASYIWVGAGAMLAGMAALFVGDTRFRGS